MAENRKVLRVKDTTGAVEQVLFETSSTQVKRIGKTGDKATVESSITTIENTLQNGVVTGVKGDNETTYRQGNVNITKENIGLGNVTNDSQVKRSEMGSANGVATLGADGKVPSTQLPSYVDDVLEFTSKSNFPTTGETGKIYVAKDTNLTYRWGGTSYVEISPSLALGETSSTAYAGDKGKANRDDINAILDGTKTVKVAEEAIDAITAEKVENNMRFRCEDNNETEQYLDFNGEQETELSFDTGDFVSTKEDLHNMTVSLRESGVNSGTYSAVQVNNKGIVTQGAQMIEWGTAGQTTPSSNLAVGGLFFELQ